MRNAADQWRLWRGLAGLGGGYVDRVRTTEAECGLAGRCYWPKDRPRRAVLIGPGLQAFGLGDERMDRLARALASSGALVWLPLLTDHFELRVSVRAVDELERGLDLLGHLAPAARVQIFSVSVGSFAALALASRRDDVAEIFVYGGMLSWRACIEHALGEGPTVDPRLTPAVFINLIDQLENRHRQVLKPAWRAFARATWRSPRKHDDGFATDVATEIEAGLPAQARDVFRIGCGLEPGARELGRTALEQASAHLDVLSAARYVPDVRATTHVIHGLDDDVIPLAEGIRLHRALPENARGQLWCSSLYGHSRAQAPDLLRPRAALRDLRTHRQLIAALAH